MMRNIGFSRRRSGTESCFLNFRIFRDFFLFNLFGVMVAAAAQGVMVLVLLLALLYGHYMLALHIK
jgi:hypothetical protein